MMVERLAQDPTAKKCRAGRQMTGVQTQPSQAYLRLSSQAKTEEESACVQRDFIDVCNPAQ